MTLSHLIDATDPRLYKTSTRRILAYGRAWLAAITLDRSVIMRRWPNTDRLVIEDPLAGDDLVGASVVAARLVDFARASTETTTAGDGSGQGDSQARNERLADHQPSRRGNIGDVVL